MNKDGKGQKKEFQIKAVGKNAKGKSKTLGTLSFDISQHIGATNEEL